MVCKHFGDLDDIKGLVAEWISSAEIYWVEVPKFGGGGGESDSYIISFADEIN